MRDYKPWIGVDLDGTLAFYDRFVAADHIGQPIPKMVARIKSHLAAGEEVRIVTARVGPGWRNEAELWATKTAIRDWCILHLGQGLPITATKDYQMVALYDDRAKQVIPNSGMLVEEELAKLQPLMVELRECVKVAKDERDFYDLINIIMKHRNLFE